jgi:hypothetical protein
VIAISVAFHRNPAIIFAFDHKVYAEVAHAHLRVHSITALHKQIENLTLEIRFAPRLAVGNLATFSGEWESEMLEQSAAELIAWPKLIQFDRANEIGSISCAGQRHVETLFIA